MANFIGEQFALPEAVERLRAIRRMGKDDEPIALSACDPLNLAGITSPGARVPALMGNKIVYQNGAPIASMESGKIHWRDEVDEFTRSKTIAMLTPPRGTATGARRTR